MGRTVKWACDKCRFPYDAEGRFKDDLPKGWGWRWDSGEGEFAVLCPECREKYDALGERLEADMARQLRCFIEGADE